MPEARGQGRSDRRGWHMSTEAQIKTLYNQAGRRTALRLFSFLVQGVLSEDQLSCEHSQRGMFLCSIKTSLPSFSLSLPPSPPLSLSVFEIYEEM